MNKVVIDYCKKRDVGILETLEEPIIVTTKEYYFEIYRLRIPSRFNLKLLYDKDELKNCFIITSIEMKSYESNIHSYIIDNYTGEKTAIGAINIDLKWLKEQSKFLKSYSKYPRILLTIYSYTLNGSDIVNSYLLNKTEECLNAIEKCYLNTKKDGLYFPLFFDIMDVIVNLENEEILFINNKKTNKILDTIKKNLLKEDCVKCREDNYILLLEILFDIKTKIILKAVKKYIDIIEEFINLVPKTKTKLTVYRRTKTKVVKNKNDLILPTFTSTSLDVEMTKEFGGDSCCLKVIIIPKNSSVFAAMLVSSYKDEGEILLNKNTTFRILKAPDIGLLKNHYVFDNPNYEIKLCKSVPYEYSILELVN